MGKFRLTFLSFLINIVIFTSSLSFDGLSKNEASEAYEKLTNGDLDLSKYDEELVQNEISFDEIKPHSSRNKSRRDLPYSYEQPETNNNDADYKDSAFNDDDIRYILNRIKTSRDINARTAKSTTDTFNATTTNTNDAAAHNSKSDSDLSKTFINNTTDERPAASSSAMTNTNSSELLSVIAILDQMREELELMRMSKQCSSTPDGSNCDVNGSWNSEQIGLRLELANTLTDDKLNVKLSDKAPKKVTPFKIDSSWSCSGMAFHSIGGPIYFHCLKHPMETVAIFQGMCKKCSGYETIFGQWHFQTNPKDCRQLWTFVESKNDIFRKDVLHSVSGNHVDEDINHPFEKSMNGSIINNKSKVRRNIKSNHHKLMRKSNQDSV